MAEAQLVADAAVTVLVDVDFESSDIVGGRRHVLRVGEVRQHAAGLAESTWQRCGVARWEDRRMADVRSKSGYVERRWL